MQTLPIWSEFKNAEFVMESFAFAFTFFPAQSQRNSQTWIFNKTTRGCVCFWCVHTSAIVGLWCSHSIAAAFQSYHDQVINNIGKCVWSNRFCTGVLVWSASALWLCILWHCVNIKQRSLIHKELGIGMSNYRCSEKPLNISYQMHY